VLQNDEYIAFAEDNSVEVLAMGSIQEGIDKKDKRAELYDGKDADGKDVKFMKEFAGCTVEQLEALNGSPAGQYNKTGKIPYVAIVDPHTLKEMKSMPGGAAKGGLIKAVEEAKATLAKEHGPSLKRSTLRKIDMAAKTIESTLAKDGAAKALPELVKLEATVAKESEAIKASVAALREKILEAAKTQLDDAEAKIAAGDIKAATAILKPLSSALKGTDLARRVTELLEKTKPAPEPAK
jgi:hypothetical protein